MAGREIADLDAALERLRLLAEGGLEQATAMPPAIYRNPEFHELERREIFARDWHCVGLAADLPEAGHYLSFSINDQPVFVMRGRDGVVRGFSNVCLHRMMRLVEGQGSCQRLVCPYHAWTYDLDGQLLGGAAYEADARLRAARPSPAGDPHRDLAGLDLCHAE